MPQNNSNSPISVCKDWISLQVASLPAGSPMPTNQSLARKFSISVTSVKRIVAEFRTRGALVTLRGKGTFVKAGPAITDIPLHHATDSSQDLAIAMEELICSGKLRQGDALPSLKHVVRQFRVTAATVTQAYRKLQSKGLAVKIGKRYWVGGLETLLESNLNKEISLVSRTFTRNSDFGGAGGMEISIAKMVRELANYGYAVKCYRQDQFHALCAGIRNGRLSPYGMIALNMNSKELAEISETVQKAVRTGHSARFPIVAIVNEHVRNEFQNVDIVNPGNILTSQARECCRFMKVNAIRNAVLFIGGSKPLEGFTSYVRIYAQMKDIDPQFEFNIVLSPFGRVTTPEAYIGEISKWKGDSWLPSVLSKHTHIPIKDILSRIVLAKDFRTAYKRFAGSRLWLFTHSEPASHGLEWARLKGIAIPDKLAILSLETSALNREKGITSCIQDWDRAGYLMAHALMRDIPITRSRMGYIRLSAALLSRQTG